MTSVSSPDFSDQSRGLMLHQQCRASGRDAAGRSPPPPAKNRLGPTAGGGSALPFTGGIVSDPGVWWTTMSGDTVISIFRRLIDATGGDLPAAAAEAVLQIRLADNDQARIGDLAAKSTEGTLTPAEAEEYDGYIAAADVLSLWKSKARLSLKRQPSAA
jgi:hypothetical protein